MSKDESVQVTSTASDFDGLITEEIRQRLVKKVSDLDVPKYLVARFFGITSSTLHKWLKGPTVRCSVSTRNIIMPFINGECDDCFNGGGITDSCLDYTTQYPDKVMMCMERISKMYDICSNSPHISKEFISRMDKAAFEAMKELMPSVIDKSIEQEKIRKKA